MEATEEFNSVYALYSELLKVDPFNRAVRRGVYAVRAAGCALRAVVNGYLNGYRIAASSRSATGSASLRK